MMRIKEFSEVSTGYAFRSRLVDVPDGKVYVIQPKNILSDSTISFGSGEPVRTKTLPSKFLSPGDLLVVNRGRFAAAVFYEESGEWTVPSSLIIVTIKKSSILPEYLACYLNSANGQKMYQRRLEHTTVPFISTKNLENMEIPIPTLEKQKSLIKFESSINKYSRLTERKRILYKQIISQELSSLE